MDLSRIKPEIRFGFKFYSKSHRKPWEHSQQKNGVILFTCLGHFSGSVELIQEQKSPINELQQDGEVTGTRGWGAREWGVCQAEVDRAADESDSRAEEKNLRFLPSAGKGLCPRPERDLRVANKSCGCPERGAGVQKGSRGR